MSQTRDDRSLSPGSLHDELAGKRLPSWAPWAVAAGALVLSSTGALAGVISGIPLIAVIAGMLFVVGETVWSFRVEGRRHATDRFATTVVYTAFVIAVIPLIAILFSVVSMLVTLAAVSRMRSLARLSRLLWQRSLRCRSESWWRSIWLSMAAAGSRRRSRSSWM